MARYSNILMICGCSLLFCMDGATKGEKAKEPQNNSTKVDRNTKKEKSKSLDNNISQNQNNPTKNKLTKEEGLDFFIVLENALRNNKDIKAEEKDLVKTALSKDIALSRMRPTLGVDGSYQFLDRTDWDSYKAQAFSDKNKPTKSGTFGAGVSVNQNLYRGGADKAEITSAEFITQAKKSELEGLKQKTLYEVAGLYFEILSKKREIQHIQAHIEAGESTLEVVSEMEKTGAGKYVDVLQARAALAKTNGELAHAHAEYKTLNAKLEEKCGLPIPENITAPKQLFDDSMTVAQAIDIAVKRSPTIIAAVDKLKAAKQAIKKPNGGERHGGMYPSVDLSYKYGAETNHLDKRDSYDPKDSHRSHTVGVTVTIPLYDGGLSNTQRKQAVEEASKAAIEKEKAIENVKAQIIEVWANLESSKEILKSVAVEVEAREQALHDTEEEHKAGVKIVNDVLEAQQKLLEAKKTEVQSQRSYFVNQCHAMFLLGMLNEKGLKLRCVSGNRET